MASGYNPISAESAWYDWWEASGSLHSRLMKMDHLWMPVKALSLFPHRHQTLLGLWTLNTAWLWPFRIPWFDGVLTFQWQTSFIFILMYPVPQGTACLGRRHYLYLDSIMPESLSSLQSEKISGKTCHDLGWQVSEYVSMPYLLWSCKVECFIPATRAVSQGSYSVLVACMTGIE